LTREILTGINRDRRRVIGCESRVLAIAEDEVNAETPMNVEGES
jgi:hypothetical protein